MKLDSLINARELNWVTCTGRGGRVISATRLSHYADWEGTDGSVMGTKEVMERKITERSSFDSPVTKLPGDVHMFRYRNNHGYEGIGIRHNMDKWSLSTISVHTTVTVTGVAESEFETYSVDLSTIIPYEPVL